MFSSCLTYVELIWFFNTFLLRATTLFDIGNSFEEIVMYSRNSLNTLSLGLILFLGTEFATQFTTTSILVFAELSRLILT